MTRRSLIAALALLPLAACAVPSSFSGVSLEATANEFAENLRPGFPKEAERPYVVVTTFTEENTSSVSSLSRSFSQFLTSAFVKGGALVTEPRLTNSLRLGEAGESMLSNKAADIRALAPAEYAVLGTIKPVGWDLVVSARLVRLVDGAVLASHTKLLLDMAMQARAGRKALQPRG